MNCGLWASPCFLRLAAIPRGHIAASLAADGNKNTQTECISPLSSMFCGLGLSGTYFLVRNSAGCARLRPREVSAVGACWFFPRHLAQRACRIRRAGRHRMEMAIRRWHQRESAGSNPADRKKMGANATHLSTRMVSRYPLSSAAPTCTTARCFVHYLMPVSSVCKAELRRIFASTLYREGAERD